MTVAPPGWYAPAEPFAEAIDLWLQRNWRLGLTDLARSAGTDVRTLRRYRSGESRHIELRQADKLCMALGIPLRCIAEDFRPHAEWAEEVAA